MKWPLFLPLIVFACLIAALVLALAHGDGGSNKFALHMNEFAPAIQLPVAGKTDARFSTKEWIGHPYLINFFASWCVPCHAEHDYLLELAGEHIPIIGIAFKDKVKAVKDFLLKDGNPFVTVADDRNGRTGLDWGVTGVPETFVIDAAGVIRFHQVGPLTEDIIQQQLLPAWKGLKK